MADQTSSSILVDAAPAEVMAVIADFPAYPAWVQGMKSVEVVQERDGVAEQVHFELEATPIKDSYTLAYDWNGDRSVSWHLVQGKMLKAMEGSYTLAPQAGGTEVTYRLAVDVSIPMIGMLKRKAEKVIIDTALKGLKKRVESLPDAHSMRIILFTGKGGGGKTTAAAGTAALAARAGRRTLVLSTDAAHSLADAFGVPIGAEPTEGSANLHVQQVDAQRRFEQSWLEIQEYLLSVLDAAGVDPMTAEELTVIPGAEEVLALLELRAQVLSGEWEVVVVDCAPTAETLRLLALPEALGWYMDRVLPAERRIVRALRPGLRRAGGVTMPRDAVFDAVERLHRDLEEVRDLLTGDNASVRLVLTPEAVVVAEARRSLTTLSLYGYRVDGVVANRIFPAEGADPWRQQWVEAQAGVLADVEQSFSGLPIWRSPYRASEPTGLEALVEFAHSAYAGQDPLRPTTTEPPMTLRRTPTGASLRIALPFVATSDIDLARHGDELVITVGSHRRLIALPTALGRHKVAAARMDDGVLAVRFRAQEAGSA